MRHSKFDQFAYGNSSQLHRPVKYTEQVNPIQYQDMQKAGK